MHSGEELSTLPVGWACAKLGEVLIKSDDRFDPTSSSNRRFVGLEHIQGNTGRLLAFGKSSETRSTKSSFLRGELLYGKLRPYLNKVWVADFDGVCSTDILVFRRTEFGDNKFVAYRLLNSDFVRYASQGMSGVQHPRVSHQTISGFAIALPPLSEQHRIVSKAEELFTKLDAGVKSLEIVKAQLKRYRKSVLKSAFEGKLTEQWRRIHKDELKPASKLLERIREERRKSTAAKHKEFSRVDATSLPELPEGWVWTRVGELATAIQYGYTATSTDERVGPRMLRITDIQNQSVNWEAVPYCKIGAVKKERYLLKDGDLVFARTGATVGKSYLIRGTVPEAVFASYLIRIVLSNHVQEEFIYDFFQSHMYWLQINQGSIGIGQPNVNSQTLSRIVLPIPSLPEQHKIVEEVEQRFSVADDVEKTVTNSQRYAEKLRQSILKCAFEGKLVPQDPTDAPASVLLERIESLKVQMEQDQETRKGRKRNDPKQRRLA